MVSTESEKKKYVKPEIESEKIFEQNALSCSKCQSALAVTLLGACARGVSKKS